MRHATTFSAGSTFEVRLDPDPVIYSAADSLLASQIPLRGLNRNVPEQELNLFEFAASGLAESRAGPAKIMRGKVWNSSLSRRVFHDVPDRLDGNAITPRMPGSIDPPENASIFDSRSCDPNL
jgi:hypothetical protein